jgi:molecular chaperone HscB
MQQTYFDMFGLAADFAVDLGALEQKYFQLQRLLHPDRFVGKTGAEKLAAQSQAVEVNAAYRTLSHPLERALYILKLNDILVGDENGKSVQDPELLMEVLEQREALAEIGNAKDLNNMEVKAHAEIEALLLQISSLFKAKKFKEAAQIALKLKYAYKFLDEIDGKKMMVA